MAFFANALFSENITVICEDDSNLADLELTAPDALTALLGGKLKPLAIEARSHR